MEKGKRKTILLIPLLVLPIPAVGGGAIEQLITWLLEINEQRGDARFIVISRSNEEAQKVQYQNAKIYYVDPDTGKCPQMPGFQMVWKVYNLWMRLTRNRIAAKLFPPKTPRLDMSALLSRFVIQKEQVDAVSLEGDWREEQYAHLVKRLGKDKVYTHLHSVRNGHIRKRQAVCNSISISNYVREKWVQEADIPGDNAVVLNCIDTQRFLQKTAPELRAEKRRALGIAPERFVLLYCGRIIPEKGIGELLDAMELLKEQPVQLLMIGSSNFSCAQITDFEREIQEKAARNPAVIQTGYIPNSDLPQWYALADAQIVPTVCQEGAGLVAIEGMASGLPLIVTRSGGIVEYVNEETAIIVEQGEGLAGRLADAVLALMGDSERREKMGRAGPVRAAAFNKAFYYEQFISVFRDCEK